MHTHPLVCSLSLPGFKDAQRPFSALLHPKSLPGTIPDGEAVGEESVSTTAIFVDELDDGEGASCAHAAPWDLYFDEMRDIRLEQRSGSFRCAISTPLLHYTA